MKREKAPLGKYVEIFWPAIAAYAACTALVFLALYYLLCRYSGLEGGRVLFGGWIILVAYLSVSIIMARLSTSIMRLTAKDRFRHKQKE